MCIVNSESMVRRLQSKSAPIKCYKVLLNSGASPFARNWNTMRDFFWYEGWNTEPKTTKRTICHGGRTKSGLYVFRNSRNAIKFWGQSGRELRRRKQLRICWVMPEDVVAVGQGQIMSRWVFLDNKAPPNRIYVDA